MAKLRPLVLAACKVKEIDPDTVSHAEIIGENLFLVVNGGDLVRVELSALPAEVWPESPDELGPAPDNTQAQPAKGKTDLGKVH